MRGMNRIMIVGRVGAEPEMRTGKTGTSWCSMSVVTNRAHKRGEEWVEEADWHDIRVFGEEGSRCRDKLHRGAVVAIDGALVYDSWTEQDGKRRRKARIHAHRVQLVAEARSRALPPAEGQAIAEISEPTLELPPGSSLASPG
jgi:single-strand DNA-binding protein